MPRRRPNMAGDFDAYFGNVSDLRNWQKLCADVNIPGAWNLESINACKKALSQVHVNICQLLEAYRDNKPVRRFSDKNELLQYTIDHHKFYPLSKAKKGGPVRGLLFKRG
ncbi:hypothetical protein BCIN_07g02440 [Botrytis cinerea B05.10]|uniref:Uncharacterized protein n=2 Tax=Botryotinia fuckeliana TaxID=40559 RepID=A0A384JMA6_BOTFB|nr:hypothetical protein BCIN_07g02440 [Botrytis cinerea B05.10]ATZ51640.1 hypothetical protein BCIN_07g02440 [Botrytis cinerea B05.10]CCD46284.1 hypothetical protein BofuT4_P118340.1 [Botrytis cinerea T4]